MLMTPGPTAVPPRVRDRMSQEQPNPDVDPAFRELYDGVCEKLRRVYGTDDDVVVLGGEGVLGLEAAVASLVSPGDEVLCLANGPYGHGFAEFVESYGGEPTPVSAPDDAPLDVDAVAETLAAAEDGDGTTYDVATLVHCETPTGALNRIEPALDLLNDHGAITVVDAVSSLGGTPVPTDAIDVCLGASQKCFSAPPGLATAAVSDAAWDAIEAADPDSLYTNLLPWRDTGDGFPYTHLAAEVAALDEALTALEEEGLDACYERHRTAAERCREAGRALGLDTYPDPARSSPTVTAFRVPGRAAELQRRLREEHDVTVATGLGERADDVLRIGHMGYNADVERVERAMDALGAVLDG